jgi:hypothetical protein
MILIDITAVGDINNFRIHIVGVFFKGDNYVLNGNIKSFVV